MELLNQMIMRNSRMGEKSRFVFNKNKANDCIKNLLRFFYYYFAYFLNSCLFFLSSKAPIISSLTFRLSFTTRIFWQEYKPFRGRYTHGQAHPDLLIQSGALASVTPPPITYGLKLQQKKDSLSRAQLETVVYACQAHQQFLPGPERYRRGFFLGDGAGIEPTHSFSIPLFNARPISN